MVRQVMEQILSYLGYDVAAAADGETAINLHREALDAGRPFDLVILDLTVRGGMGGKQALLKMREIDPHVQALIATGYSNDPVVQSFRKYGFSGAITKPFTLTTLRAVIRDVFECGLCGTDRLHSLMVPLESVIRDSGCFLKGVNQLPMDFSVGRQHMRGAGENSRPERSETMPPASMINKEAAAVSQGISFNSQKPSNRPAAT